MFCRNEAPYLEQAIESILNQTITGFRLLIIDDASTDDSFEIASAFARRDPRVTVIKNNIRSGYSSSYRKTFEMAGRGCQYFAWASGHDIHEPTWLEKCLTVMRGDNSVALVYCLNDRISDVGRHVRNEGLYFEATQKSALSRLAYLFKNGSGYGNMIYGVFRSDFLQKCGVYRRLLVADIVLIYEIIIYGKIIQIDEFLWHRRFDYFHEDGVNRIRKMIGRQRKNMFKKAPLYTYFPWPIVNSLAIALVSLVKPRSSFRVRCLGVIAAILFLSRYLRIERLAD